MINVKQFLQKVFSEIRSFWITFHSNYFSFNYTPWYKQQSGITLI